MTCRQQNKIRKDIGEKHFHAHLGWFVNSLKLSLVSLVKVVFLRCLNCMYRFHYAGNRSLIQQKLSL